VAALDVRRVRQKQGLNGATAGDDATTSGRNKSTLPA